MKNESNGHAGEVMFLCPQSGVKLRKTQLKSGFVMRWLTKGLEKQKQKRRFNTLKRRFCA